MINQTFGTAKMAEAGEIILKLRADNKAQAQEISEQDKLIESLRLCIVERGKRLVDKCNAAIAQAQEIDELKGSVEIGETLSIETGANLLALLAKSKEQSQEIERLSDLVKMDTDEVDGLTQENERLQNAICIYVREESPSYADVIWELDSDNKDEDAINLFVKHNQE